MSDVEAFNVRVYGIFLQEGFVLMSRESFAYRGEPFVKFPGGGVELGEAPVESLQREIEEEMGLSCRVGESYFIARKFVKSFFNPTQVISLFFRVYDLSGPVPVGVLPNPPHVSSTVEFFFHPLADLSPEMFTFPHEKDVAAQLIADFT